jgi:predicted transcriptional regulator
MSSHKGVPVREHIAYQLLYELRATPLGRRTLVKRTGLTESVVRTELEKLEARKLVSFSKLGTALTARGRRFLSEKLSAIIDIPRGSAQKFDARSLRADGARARGC